MEKSCELLVNGDEETVVSAEEKEFSKNSTASNDDDDDVVSSKVDQLADCFKRILAILGEDVHRPGLENTPDRAAQALLFLTRGYGQNLKGLFLICLLLWCKNFPEKAGSGV